MNTHENLCDAIRDLIHAALPFTTSDVVTETSGTIPLMEELKTAIETAREVLKSRYVEMSSNCNKMNKPDGREAAGE
jgi:hypothetical protein